MNKICTSIEQSKKLIGLGINTNTADMHYWQNVIIAFPFRESKHQEEAVPLWSLSGLLELIPPYLKEFKDGIDFGLSKAVNRKWYSVHYLQCKEDGFLSSIKTVTGDTAVDAAFEMVCWLLENGHIKKEKASCSGTKWKEKYGK